jgi:hypothetical protein
MFCYETTRISVNTSRPDFTFDPLKCNAVRAYMRHYENFLFLTFMSNNGTVIEKHQAAEEMKICKRKMKFWEQQPHFVSAEALRKKADLNRRAQL